MVSDHLFGAQRRTNYVHSFTIHHYFIFFHTTLNKRN